MEFLHNFLDSYIIFSSHTVYFHASTKDFTPIYLVLPRLYYSLIRP